jgi:hypothetical protein
MKYVIYLTSDTELLYYLFTLHIVYKRKDIDS